MIESLGLGLTRREAEVLARVAQGKTNAEIGKVLGMSPRTAGKHLENIYRKLGVETRTAAAAKAIQADERKRGDRRTERKEEGR